MNKKATAAFVLMLMITALVPSTICDEESEASTGIHPIDSFIVSIGNAFITIGNLIKEWGGEKIYNNDGDIFNQFTCKIISNYVTEDLSVLMATIAGLIDNNTQTWNLAQSYIDRSAEISAGTLWSPMAVYNPETILTFAGIYNLLATSQENNNSALSYAIDNIADRVDSWSNSDYSSIGVSLVWDGASTNKATSSAKLIFNTIVDASQGKDRVYLSSGDTTKIWALDGDGQLIDDNGQIINLSAGLNDLNVSGGWYFLSPGHYAGPFLPTANGARGALCLGGAIISVDEKYGYAVMDGNDLKINYDGEYKSSYLKYRYQYNNGASETQTMSGKDCIKNVIRAYSDQYDTYKKIIARASQAGQIMWSLIASTGESNALISPSSISPRLSNVGIDANQSYAMYVSALMQMSDYYRTYGSQLNALQTKISSESLQLYCRGTLYNSDGTVLKSNVVFTPYVYNKPITIYTGTNTIFNQDGIVMVWTPSNAISALSKFSSSDVKSHNIVIMPKGTYVIADEISYNGNLIPTVTLRVKEIEHIDLLSDIFHKNITPPKSQPVTTLVTLVFIEFAGMIALSGVLLKRPSMFVISIIIVIATFLFPNFIARIFVGIIGI